MSKKRTTLSPQGRAGEGYLPILTYHRIVDASCKTGKHNIYLSADRFRKQLEYLKKNNFQAITFRDLENVEAGSFHKKVLLTFDDGYEDNYTVLFPLLKEFGFTAVVFLVTRLSRNEWGMKEGEPGLKMMSPEMIREMNAYGIEFGAHTQTHIDLSKANPEKIKQEVSGSKADVETITNKPAISFAYPFGGLNEEVKAIVKQSGYKYGIATKSGPKNWPEDLMQIQRIEITNKTTLFSFKRKVSGFYLQKKRWLLF